ncbi:hypothetical protein QJS04_geneDACA005372 [Acorus gramineus]|uniref:Embryo defective 2219 n=1 Tax=Acorus gramineus TaxID=55184 RepID=A0AAV9AZH9_ACOGR|nr:hypothetical protein QJS04_geneDACA005372 [Acorus gramineus]
MYCHHHHPLAAAAAADRNPNPRNPFSPPKATPSLRLSALQSPDPLSISSSSTELPEDVVFRTHNAKSTALLRRLPQPELRDDEMMLMEAELSKFGQRRNHRFPGSISVSHDQFDGIDDVDDRKVERAIEIRRAVAAEVLKQALRASKLSITYSENLVSRLPEFVDRVIIEAAFMKREPEFSHSTFNARVKACIQRSNVVPLVKWLKHNSLTYSQIGKLICKCPGNLECLRQMVEWLKSIHVKGESLGSVLIKAGPVLGRITEELDDIVGYLEMHGVRRDWVGFVIGRCPQVLALTMEELDARTRFYMDMGMNERDFGTMVFDYPRSLGFFSLEEMNSKVNYLKEFGLGADDVGRLLAFKPQLMGCSIEERWKPLVKYLYYLGVRRDGMRRILTMKPMIFCVDLETTIVPKVRFLQDIGIREEAVGSALVKFPPLLTYSLYKKIRPVVIFLITKAGVAQKDIGKVIALEPALLGCSIFDKLEVNVKYFLSLGIRQQLLGEMIADFPMLLKYNLDILRPKYRYLRRIMVRPLQDLIEFPRFFSYSLDGRIAPRHKILVENRINFKLRYMLAGSNEEFSCRVEAAVERRRRFESGIIDNDNADDDDSHVMESEAHPSSLEMDGFDESKEENLSENEQQCLLQVAID